jgi:hypothetical protein
MLPCIVLPSNVMLAVAVVVYAHMPVVWLALAERVACDPSIVPTRVLLPTPAVR